MRFRAISAAALIGLFAAPALAATVHFKATLDGRSETPSIDTPGKGALLGAYDTDTHVLTYRVVYAGLSGPATMAHFHGPARSGQTAPPVVAISDPSSPISGHVTLTSQQWSDLGRGFWYFNVHTAAHPDGEIRGQLKRDVDWDAAEQPAGPPTGWQFRARGAGQIGNR